MHRVAEENVRLSLQRIRRESAVLRELEAEGRLRIVGAMYEMETGVVTMVPE